MSRMYNTFESYTRCEVRKPNNFNSVFLITLLDSAWFF